MAVDKSNIGEPRVQNERRRDSYGRSTLSLFNGFLSVVSVVAPAVMAVFLVATEPLSAQNSGPWFERDDARPAREVLIGTITTGRPDAADRSSVPDHILADGLDALRRGDVMLGRRRLEAVVDAYPDSVAAKVARDELGVLYNLRQRNSTPISPPGTIVAPPQAEWIPTQNSAPGADRTTANREARERERESRLGERRLRTLAYEFQAAAGDRIFFAENSADVGTRARAVLVTQARWLALHEDLPVVIEAHADDFGGNRDREIEISERRAKAVQDRLIQEGVDSSRITIVAHGRDRPVAICQAAECGAQNRRVVTRVGSPPASARDSRTVELPAFATMPPRVTVGPRD